MPLHRDGRRKTSTGVLSRSSLRPQGDDRILLHGAPGRQRDRQRRDDEQHRRSGGDCERIARALGKQEERLDGVSEPLAPAADCRRDQ
jgi:hypothetical protein